MVKNLAVVAFQAAQRPRLAKSWAKFGLTTAAAAHQG